MKHLGKTLTGREENAVVDWFVLMPWFVPLSLGEVEGTTKISAGQPAASGAPNLPEEPLAAKAEAMQEQGDAALATRGCDAGKASDCAGLASMYAEGKGVAKDLARAAALYEKACDGGDTASCFFLEPARISSQAPCERCTMLPSLDAKRTVGGQDAFRNKLVAPGYGADVAAPA